MCAADRAGAPSFDQQDPDDNIVQGFGAVGDSIPAGRRVVPSSEPWRVTAGAKRGEAVAAHLRIQNRELVDGYTMALKGGYPARLVDSLQAAAASTETMADLLSALVAGQQKAAARVLELFVNDAVNTGVVIV
jgi:hypothetical protein